MLALHYLVDLAAWQRQMQIANMQLIGWQTSVNSVIGQLSCSCIGQYKNREIQRGGHFFRMKFGFFIEWSNANHFLIMQMFTTVLSPDQFALGTFMAMFQQPLVPVLTNSPYLIFVILLKQICPNFSLDTPTFVLKTETAKRTPMYQTYIGVYMQNFVFRQLYQN